MKDQPMHSDHSDETLMAFADGLLDEPLFSAVAEAIETDPLLAERLEKLVAGADLAKAGFAPLLQPVPAALEGSVRAAIARAERASRPKWQLTWKWALPASGFALAAIALAFVLAGQQIAQPWSPLPGLANPALNAALDSLPSGQSQDVEGIGAVHAVTTFTDANGTLCREFEAGEYMAIACRADAEWTIALAVAMPTGEEAYRTASGTATIDQFLQEIGANPPLLDALEADALAR